MELIWYYLVFALATGITICIFALAPLVNEARELGVENTFTRNPKLSYLVYIILTAIIAPLVFCTLLFPATSQKFSDGLRKEVFKADE